VIDQANREYSVGLNPFKKYLGFAAIAFGILCSITIILMMLSTTADVSRRYLFGHPISGTVEFNELLLVLMVYFGLLYTQKEKLHINVNVFTQRLNPRFKNILLLFSYTVGIAFFGLVFYAGIDPFVEAWVMQTYRFGAIEFLLWPSKGLVVVGSLLLCLQFISDILDIGKGLLKEHIPSAPPDGG